MGLIWAAAGVSGVAAAVSIALIVRMDDLFTAAVAQGRAFPLDFGAGDLRTFPYVLGVYCLVVAAATAALGYVLRGWAYQREHFGPVVPVGALLAVVAFGLPAVLPVWELDDQYTHDIYGWWYVPFLVGAALSYACAMAAAVVGLSSGRVAARTPSA